MRKQKITGSVEEWVPGVTTELESVIEERMEEVSDEVREQVLREEMGMKLRMILERKGDGRKKGRLIGQGFLEGEEVTGTYVDSPVSSFAAVRMLLFLNGEEGDALERIIRLIDCPFLALSATIKNSQQLQNWFQKAVPSRPVELEVVRSRFINLQRHVWSGNELEELHPCAALTREQILTEGFDAGDLAFTARDVYSLYKAMKKNYGDDVMKDVKPSKCVFPKEVNERVTMKHVTDYEKVLKDRMTLLAKTMPVETDNLLNEFKSVATSTGLDQISEVQTKGESKRNTDTKGEEEDADAVIIPCHAICLDLKKKEMTPAVVFQMDANKCRKMFVKVSFCHSLSS